MKKFIGLLFLGLFSGNLSQAGDHRSVSQSQPTPARHPAVEVVPAHAVGPIAPSKPCAVARRGDGKVSRGPSVSRRCVSLVIRRGQQFQSPRSSGGGAARTRAISPARDFKTGMPKGDFSSGFVATIQGSLGVVSAFQSSSRSTSPSAARTPASSVRSPVRSPRPAVDL